MVWYGVAQWGNGECQMLRSVPEIGLGILCSILLSYGDFAIR